MVSIRHSKRILGSLLLGLLVSLTVVAGMLPTACSSCGSCGSRSEDANDAYLCFTPANTSLVVGDLIQVVATLQPDDLENQQDCIEMSGWLWGWESDDDGEIEFSQIELQWSGPSEGIYVAQVQCTARKKGTVLVGVEQPDCKRNFVFLRTSSCINTCTITITETWSPW